jgi:hypothetical protein
VEAEHVEHAHLGHGAAKQVPYSPPPPQMLAIATVTLRFCMSTMRNDENDGWIEMLNPP